jgi:MoaA/NifB/PqqE/SkfB family radical SAM enzyme
MQRSPLSPVPCPLGGGVGVLPLDHPTPERPHRVYVALTNHCNRACPWCSTCSSPAGSTFLTHAAFHAVLPARGQFELQLEGGEPLLHPDFWELVRLARAHERCTRLVLCTNGVLLPRPASALPAWLARLGEPLTVKVALNHHLIERDPNHVARCVNLRDRLAELGGERALVVNVRLRRGYADDDRAVRDAVAEAGLAPHANVFFLQRYGFASGEQGWEPPRLVWDNFTLVNPDGRVFGPDLLARSAAMGELP